MSNKSLRQRNIEFFQENNQDILQQIKNKNSAGRYRVAPARTGGLFYIEPREGGLPLHSRYNPEREAEMWAGEQDLEGLAHVILFGLGLGYHVEALLKRNPRLRLYIYEPDVDLFLAGLDYRDWSAFPWERVYLILEDGGGRYNAFIGRVLSLVKSGWGFLPIPSFERCFPAPFSELKDNLTKQKTDYLDTLKSNIVFEKEWTVNALLNLPYILQCDSVFTYKEQFQGRTAIMTASGPSLSRALPYLHEIKEKGKALLIAAGTSVNGLLKQGLTPDLFVSYDPFPANFKALQPSLAKGVPLVFGSTINNDVVKNHVGARAHFILGQDTLFRFLKGGLDPFEVVGDAPSIAVVTLQLLDKLGIQEIILAGQDLAFDGDRYYAEGVGAARADSVSDEDKRDAFEVEANDGGMALTNKSFNRMRQSMELLIKGVHFRRIVNTSSSGARIAGTVFMGWPQIIRQLSSKTQDKPLAFRRHVKANSLRAVRRRVNAILADTEKGLEHVREEAEEFAAEGLDDEKRRLLYDRLYRYFSHLTSSREYAAFISPMVRNEDHLLGKSLLDLPGMTWEEKQALVGKDLRIYLRGVQLSVAKLKEAMDSAWGKE